jgi:hypothetical protein
MSAVLVRNLTNEIGVLTEQVNSLVNQQGNFTQPYPNDITLQNRDIIGIKNLEGNGASNIGLASTINAFGNSIIGVGDLTSAVIQTPQLTFVVDGVYQTVAYQNLDLQTLTSNGGTIAITGSGHTRNLESTIGGGNFSTPSNQNLDMSNNDITEIHNLTLKSGAGGVITFEDGTTQSTAGGAGGNFSTPSNQNLDMSNNDITEIHNLTLKSGAGGVITFADGTTQSTAGGNVDGVQSIDVKIQSGANVAFLSVDNTDPAIPVLDINVGLPAVSGMSLNANTDGTLFWEERLQSITANQQDGQVYTYLTLNKADPENNLIDLNVPLPTGAATKFLSSTNQGALSWLEGEIGGNFSTPSDQVLDMSNNNIQGLNELIATYDTLTQSFRSVDGDITTPTITHITAAETVGGVAYGVNEMAGFVLSISNTSRIDISMPNGASPITPVFYSGTDFYVPFLVGNVASPNFDWVKGMILYGEDFPVPVLNTTPAFTVPYAINNWEYQDPILKLYSYYLTAPPPLYQSGFYGFTTFGCNINPPEYAFSFPATLPANTTIISNAASSSVSGSTFYDFTLSTPIGFLNSVSVLPNFNYNFEYDFTDTQLTANTNLTLVAGNTICSKLKPTIIEYADTTLQTSAMMTLLNTDTSSTQDGGYNILRNQLATPSLLADCIVSRPSGYTGAGILKVEGLVNFQMSIGTQFDFCLNFFTQDIGTGLYSPYGATPARLTVPATNGHYYQMSINRSFSFAVDEALPPYLFLAIYVLQSATGATIATSGLGTISATFYPYAVSSI